MAEAVIVGAVRTPLGKQGGVLSPVRPDDLAAITLGALMERTGVPPEEVEDVYMGCANQAGEDNRDVARMALLLAGFPEEVGGTTVNRLCGSGLDAVAGAAREIMLGEAHAWPAFSKFPISSFFFVSTLMTGSPAAKNAAFRSAV